MKEQSGFSFLTNLNKARKDMGYMSQEGYDHLIAELKRLEGIERPEPEHPRYSERTDAGTQRV